MSWGQAESCGMTGQNVADGVGCRQASRASEMHPTFQIHLNNPVTTLGPFCAENFLQIPTFHFSSLWL